MKTGRNIFLTGEPGAGKSYTIRQYVNYLRSCGIEPAITASTGIAATHIGGVTLHSWSGIGINKTLDSRELKELAGQERTAKRIRKAEVLIIDEISMFDGRILDLVDAVCRSIKDFTRPFGGMQVIFVGDFFQLPPVSRAAEGAPQFAFASQSWAAADPTVCYLSEQHRQDDERFLKLLSALRRGKVTNAHKELLGERQVVFLDDDEFVDMTKLYSHNVDVDQLNTYVLSRLETSPRTYTMSGYGAPPLIEQLKRGCLSPESLVLKIGARVMFTKNNPDGSYVNGTTGEVIGFSEHTKHPLVKLRSGRILTVIPSEWKIEAEGRTLAAISQIPLRLAWAMTVHKSQGMSLDAALIDLSSAFAYGQGYVALSRVRTLAGLHLRGLNERALEVDPDVLAQDAAFRESSLDAQDKLRLLAADKLQQQHEEFITARGGKMNSGFVSRPSKKKSKEKKYEQTLALILEGKTIAQVADERSRTIFTIFDHLEELCAAKLLDVKRVDHLIANNRADIERIQHTFKRLDTTMLKPVFEALQGQYNYHTIRLARLFL